MEPKNLYLEKQSFAGQIYELIKNDIFNQKLVPGQKLNIRQLSEKLNCSIVPVREALSRLYAEKLIDFTPYRGYVVTESLNESSFIKLFDVRELLEVRAIELAVDNMTASDLGKMENIIKSGDVEIDASSYENFQSYIESNYQFHLMIVEIADNKFLLEAWNSLSINFHLSRVYYQRGYVNTEPQTTGHMEVYQALKAGDRSAAIAAMQKHLSGGFGRLFSGKTTK